MHPLPARDDDRDAAPPVPVQRDRAYRLAAWAFAILVALTILLLAAGIVVSWLQRPTPPRPQGAPVAAAAGSARVGWHPSYP